MTERDDWRRMAELQDLKDREKLMKRLEAGEEINLEEALFLADVRNNSQVFRLGDFLARGRIGSSLRKREDIPQDAWLHLELRRNTLPFTVKEPTGVEIFSLLFRLPTATDPDPDPATGGEPAATPSASAMDMVGPIARVDQTEANDEEGSVNADDSPDLDAFFGELAGGKPTWTRDDYRKALEGRGLSLGDMDRVPGVLVENGTISYRINTNRDLKTILLGIFMRERVRSQTGKDDNRQMARDALRWLSIHHPALVVGRRDIVDPKENNLDGMYEKMCAAGFIQRGRPKSEK